MCSIILFLSSFLFLWNHALSAMDEKPPEKKPPHQKQFFFSTPPRTPRSTASKSVPSPRSAPPKKEKEEVITLHYKPHKQRRLRSDSTETDVTQHHKIDKGKKELGAQEQKPSFIPAKIKREKVDEAETESPRHTFLSQESRGKRPTIFSLPSTKRKNTDAHTSSKPSSRDQSPQKTSGRSKDTQSLSLPTAAPSPRKSLRKSSTPPNRSPHISPKASPKQKIMGDDDLIKAVQKGKTKDIEEFLNNENNDPNQQSIGPKNTLLHLAVLYDKKKPGKNISMLFLTHPCVNTLIKNNYNCAPFQCIAKEEIRNNSELYEALKLRATLDHIVNALLMTDLKIIEKNNNTETALHALHTEKKSIIKKLEALVLRVQNIIPVYAHAKFIFALLKSRIEYNFPRIVLLIRNRELDPNAQNDWGNTCLHDAVYLRDKQTLLSYLQNPRVNSLITNSEKLLAHQLITATENQYSELRRLLFARNSLDTWIKEQFPQFSFMYPGDHRAQLNDLEFQTLIKKIKDTSERIKNAQKDKDEKSDDRELPEETIYPDYATEQFLLDRFNTCKKHEKPDASEKSLTEESKQKSNLEIFNEILVELDSSSVSHVEK